jgi:hypothetical protein
VGLERGGTASTRSGQGIEDGMYEWEREGYVCTIACRSVGLLWAAERICNQHNAISLLFTNTTSIKINAKKKKKKKGEEKMLPSNKLKLRQQAQMPISKLFRALKREIVLRGELQIFGFLSYQTDSRCGNVVLGNECYDQYFILNLIDCLI